MEKKASSNRESKTRSRKHSYLKFFLRENAVCFIVRVRGKTAAAPYIRRGAAAYFRQEEMSTNKSCCCHEHEVKVHTMKFLSRL